MNMIEAQDLGISFAMNRLHHPWLTALMQGLSFVGDRYTLAAILVLALLLFLVQRRWRTACCLAAAVAVAGGIDVGLKTWVHRQRPDLNLAWVLIDKPSSFSFPSGHAMMSMAVIGGIALSAAAGMHRRGPAIAVVVVGLALPVLIGFSRMYLGVHYMTDVLGGLCGGLACVLLFRWVDLQWSNAVSPLAA